MIPPPPMQPEPESADLPPVPVPELRAAPPNAEASTSESREAVHGTSAGPARRRPVPRRLAAVVAVAAAVVLLVGGALVGVVGPSSPVAHQSSAAAAGVSGNRTQIRSHPSLNLAPATSAPAPAPPSVAAAPPVQSHEVFGYAPYWTLPQSSAFNVANLTTLAYFSVDANADGSLDQSGAGWNGYQSQDLVNLVTRAHAAGDRVVLTVTCFDQSTLDQITSDPNAPDRLSAALISAVQAKNLDGVNFDFEGEGSADRVGLTNLLTKVSAALHGTNPHWQVSMATYASAASDTAGFYDVAALAPAIDVYFVMAYDMNSRTQPSATSPLFGPAFTDAMAIEEYLKVVPPSKVILGLPLYGYDWPTVDSSPTSPATGPESPLSDSVIAAAGHPTYWDPVTDTPWTAYQVGTQWHRTYFDDPTSLALKAQLANYFKIAGVGIWALGMDGNDPANLAALLGNAPVAKDTLTGPPPGTGYLTFASFGGTDNIALTPIATPPAGGVIQLVGTLSAFTTAAPTLACLQAGPPIQVLSDSLLPGVLLAQATTPTYCAAALWSFPAPPPAPASTTTTTTTQGSGSSTTSTAPVASSTTTAPKSSTSTTTSPSTTTSTSTPSTTTPSSTTTTSTTSSIPAQGPAPAASP